MKDRMDIYASVTERIISQLNDGIIPWRQPWNDLTPPHNLISGRHYRGINRLLLSCAKYETNAYLTFRQAKDLGASIKKGEKAHLIVFWHKPKQTEPTDENTSKTKAVLRYYFVFNVSQCSNLPTSLLEPTQRPTNDPIEVCEEIVARMPNSPGIEHGGDEAYYQVEADQITMPYMKQFYSSSEYYHTLFHELIHSTGHIKRLDRKEIMVPNAFASDSYSLEELTAEIGACYLSSYTGIEMQGLVNEVSYIQHWLKRLKDDKRFIFQASTHAQRATDYILNIRHEDTALAETTDTHD